MKYFLVTGCRTGIGLAITKKLLNQGYAVFGSCRTSEQAKILGAELGQRFFPLVFDVCDLESIQSAIQAVEQVLGPTERLAGLVNNAGIVIFGPLAVQPIKEIEMQIQTNLVGAIAVVQAFLPLLGTDPQRVGLPGKIINMSSVAGMIGTPFLGAYAATKYAMEGWSESLRRELLMYGIDVVIIGPGSVKTPIWDKAEVQGVDSYKGTPYEKSLSRFYKMMLKMGRSGLDADEIASKILQVFERRHNKTRYALVPQAFKNWFLPRWLPKRRVDMMMARALHLLSPDVGFEKIKKGNGPGV